MPFGLDFPALAMMAPSFGLACDQRLFEKLRAYEAACLEAWVASDGSVCTIDEQEHCRIEFGPYFERACKECSKKKNHG